MITTRVIYSKNINIGKFEELKKQAKILGQFRSEIWQKYGSLNGVGANRKKRFSEIRTQYIKTGKLKHLPSNTIFNL
ncbi:MAG: hypothetical protein OEY79_01345 [Anaplasmataceae bacterium]|nr:hypothetical protein [Anaplasmataceae bacterium]